MLMTSITALIVLGLSVYLYQRRKKQAQRVYIERYQFAPAIAAKVKHAYPHLNDKDVELVLQGLRDYFYICHQAGNKMVAMPSQVVDVAWHEFILFTRNYQQFCKKALGRFLHHTPSEAMRTKVVAQDGIRRAWRLACAKSNLPAAAPTQLPLLFALDSQLKIKDGFVYALDCKNKKSPLYGDGYCAAHIGCSSGCAGDSGSTSSSSDSFGGDSSCGGGCGGGD
ncbi:glycine-rich domain-containing protein [Pseudoalteromonas sp. T1lg76]|uniref:glycine-rich domain-containing protein n=1 Tax=Pseudoalteromonas sp. T1lg76 TaxID=2077103 RepID=UPI0018F878B8|nr:hypothetical protein [Pseudoalteromonas sp. T1lg76]